MPQAKSTGKTQLQGQLHKKSIAKLWIQQPEFRTVWCSPVPNLSRRIHNRQLLFVVSRQLLFSATGTCHWDPLSLSEYALHGWLVEDCERFGKLLTSQCVWRYEFGKLDKVFVGFQIRSVQERAPWSYLIMYKTWVVSNLWDSLLEKVLRVSKKGTEGSLNSLTMFQAIPSILLG